MKTSSFVLAAALLVVSNVNGFVSQPSRTSSCTALNAKSIVVVSPPGGVGEVTAVKAASLGASVKWFIVSSKQAKLSQSVTFSQDALREIEAAGGKVELAGAEAQALLEERDALAAVSTWCGSAQGLVCCLDGSDNVVVDTEDTKTDFAVMWQNAVKMAAKEASKGVSGRKMVILSQEDDDEEEGDDEEDGGFLGGLFGGDKDETPVPASLSAAIKADTKLRHGALFGIPESSPSFSVLLGGPQKNPTLCDEYQMRMVRMDPSSGGTRKDIQSCRHVVGEAAALMMNDKVQAVKDVSITSLRGMDKFDLWTQEFDRVADMDRKGQGAQLFSTSFSSVPSIDRLSAWIATKWAPAVMRTYDIAGIRIGARPVYATQIDESLVEIVWQELVDYQSVTVGRLLIRIANDGITATRGPGDPSKGFGTISRKPLNGEAVLVQRLADAASQAMEKGLANKPAGAKKVAAPVAPKKAEPAVVSSLQSAETVAPPESSASGPRAAGARRSSEKARGKRTRRATTDDANDEEAKTEEPGAFE